MDASGLKRYASRSVLTGAGIAVSVASMIALASLAHSVKLLLTEGVVSLGSHVLMVGPSPQGLLSGRPPRPLTVFDGAAIRARVGDVDSVAPISATQGLVSAEAARRVVTIFGIMPGMEGLSGFEVSQGRFIVDIDIAVASHVVVVSQKVADAIGAEVGETVWVSGRPFRVVGVVSARSQLLGVNREDSIFVPATTADAIYQTAPSRAGFVIRVRDDASVVSAQDGVRYALRATRGLTGDEPDDFVIQSQTELLESVDRIEATAQAVLLALMGIGLVIAAIGILNSVMTSVLERTTEIGLRRAVGATRLAVQAAFLLEALTIAAGGAGAGVGIGWSFAALLAHFLALPVAIDWRVTAIAFTVTLMFGGAAALWPAIRAGRLSPVTALHHE